MVNLLYYYSHFPFFIITMEKGKQLEEGGVNFVSELDETVNHVKVFMYISMYIAGHTVSAVRNQRKVNGRIQLTFFLFM